MSRQPLADERFERSDVTSDAEEGSCEVRATPQCPSDGDASSVFGGEAFQENSESNFPERQERQRRPERGKKRAGGSEREREAETEESLV